MPGSPCNCLVNADVVVDVDDVVAAAVTMVSGGLASCSVDEDGGKTEL